MAMDLLLHSLGLTLEQPCKMSHATDTEPRELKWGKCPSNHFNVTHGWMEVIVPLYIFVFSSFLFHDNLYHVHLLLKCGECKET